MYLKKNYSHLQIHEINKNMALVEFIPPTEYWQNTLEWLDMDSPFFLQTEPGT